MKKIYLLFLITLLTLTPYNTNATTPEKNLEDLSSWAMPVGKNMFFAYLGCWACLISHEFGHALVDKMFTGSKIDIHLGASYDEEEEGKVPLFETENISIYSPNPFRGGYSKAIPAKFPVQRFLSNIAGGVFEKIQTYFVLAGIATYHKYQERGNICSRSVHMRLMRSPTFDSIPRESGIVKLDVACRCCICG